MEHFSAYFKALQAADLSEITEHSLRPDLKNLLSAVAATVDGKIAILHEGKREGKFGAPDFKITRVENIIGYVENKKIGESLDKILKSDQIKKYQQLSENILITNYLEWVWLNKGNLQRETLCDLSEIEHKKTTLDPSKIAAVEALLRGFLSFAPEGIGKPKALAQALAIRGKVLKEFLDEELHRQNADDIKGKLFGLYQTFQKYIFNELTLTEFADTFSQNLIYGLFLAKLNADTTAITLQNAELFISANFELIRELVEFLKVLQRKEYADIRWVVEEILTILNTMNFRDIKIALSFTRSDADSDDPYAVKDPYVYFYEDFLAAYDKALRKAKGVYYTPPQVVNFIVRAVDDTLRETFGLPDGLADNERVTVLDFATGTGTFLLEVMRQIFQKFPDPAMQHLLIREHVLKNLYGFEYLIAPYTIAHLKLSQFLKDQGYALSEEERLQIFLTNTLEPTDPQMNIPMLPALTEETQKAQHVKDKPILVILGNPPYSGHSKNNGAWIKDKLQAYYQIDGKKLDEKNPKWLQDDYVKFIRFAQDKMDQVEEGMVAIITNHAFLENPTFRGMRQSLMNTFHQMYFIDLHGSVKKKEISSTGEKDENVFDIEPGVAISILVKKPGLEKRVYRSDFWGTREQKYQQSLISTIHNLPQTELSPSSPFYMFQYQNQDTRDIYKHWLSLLEIFEVNVLGFQTHRDHFAIDFEEIEISTRMNDFCNTELDDNNIYQKYSLKDSRDWKLADVRKKLQQVENKEEHITRCAYRPFDNRFCFLSYIFMDCPRKELIENVLKKDNLCLLSSRQQGVIGYQHSFVTNLPANDCLISNKSREANQVFLLYKFHKPRTLFNQGEKPLKAVNFTETFQQFMTLHYKNQYSPEMILGYMYAILYSPTYRAKYAEFLKIDFPRIPFAEDHAVFETLSTLGWQLIQAHLLKEIPAYDIGQYVGEGNNEVVKPEYRQSADYERLYINKTQYFDRVPEAVYRFQIGGYQVVDKYLKDRKERTLTLSDVKTLRNTIKALAFTIDQMQKIDEATRDWI